MFYYIILNYILEWKLGIVRYSFFLSFVVRAEEIMACNENLCIKLRGSKLDKKDTFGKSDPFLVFYKSNEDQR